MSLMLSPFPCRTFIVSSGTVYVADTNGVIANVGTVQDQLDLQAAGCVVLQPPPSNLIGKLTLANFDITTDQQITLLINVKFRITKITVENASVAGMSTAAGGIYTAATKGGTAIVAAGQVYTGLTNAATALDLTLAAPNLVLPALQSLFFSLTTAQGALATASLYVFGDVYPS